MNARDPRIVRAVVRATGPTDAAVCVAGSLVESVEWADLNPYFPPESILQGHLVPSSETSHCHWKGNAIYYNVRVGPRVLENVAWSYPQPLEGARHLAGRIAFGPEVDIRITPQGEDDDR